MKPAVQETTGYGTTNIIQAQTFLNALEPNRTFTFQTFDDGKKKRKELARIFHGTFAQHRGTLTALNNQGAGIFVMVNAGNGTGRSKANVTGIYAIFADFDGVSLPETWLLEPHIMVESSRSKYHIYWLVIDVSLEDFPIFQKVRNLELKVQGI